MEPPETIEEELAIIAEAIDAGIDPFPTEERAQWMGEDSSWLVHDHHHGELGLAVALPLFVTRFW
ncbi:MAG: hypothetical protein CM1200mP32_02050 [Methanobacteriota archaeon]|nr:MAG: hypothetical protein CM1200mP32_02050 [Euryarchaeota archaeon]